MSIGTDKFLESNPDDLPPSVSSIWAPSLLVQYPNYREELIEGIFRKGETVNIISAPKIGKSWLVLQMALGVANGSTWLGKQCRKGNVLVADNELHLETIAQRIKHVSQATGLDCKDLAVLSLRGKESALDKIRDLLIVEAKKVHAELIIIDALYRSFPQGISENSNADITALYNLLDNIAEESGASIALVHHSSKGDQSSKAVEDGGAGAGAIARATDTHLFLRHHEQDGLVAVDARCRSLKPIESFVITRESGIWELEAGADPTRLKGKESPNSSDHLADDTILSFLRADHADLNVIRARIEKSGYRLSKDKLKGRLAVLVETGQAFSSIGGRCAKLWGLKEQPDSDKRGKVTHLLNENPGVAASVVAAEAGCSERYVLSIKKELF